MVSDPKVERDLALGVEKFRARVRNEWTPSWYYGPGHLFFNAAILIGTIVFYSNLYVNFKWIDLWPFLFVAFFGNFAVYMIHKIPLHGINKSNWNSFGYKVHTRKHHVFFTPEHMTFKSTRDFNTIFFAVELVLIFLFVYHPFFYFLLKPLIGENATYSYLMASSGYFIAYEIVHYASHLPSGHWMMKIPHFKKMRRHHQLHHDPRIMRKANFTIVYPLMDKLMGTYLDDEGYKKLFGKLPGSGDTNA